MKRVIFLACLTLSGYASSQDGYQWVNATLRERRVPLAQYVAIGKGHFAQCQISSNRDAHAAVKERLRGCNWDEIPAFCAGQKGQAQSESEELYKTLFVGCMAEKGWAWTKVN